MKRKVRLSVRNIFFIIAGTGSLLWFLIRVIPKPSRAAYPCMRAAAPIASSFVLYLLGIFASAALFKKSKEHYFQSRYFLASLFLTAALFTGLLTTMTADKPAYANEMAFSQPANAPVGTAKGIFPGRVVWIYNPDATAAGCTNSYGDGYFLAKNNNQTVIDQMVSLAIQQMTGTSNDAGAWDAIFRYYNQNHGKGSTGYAAGEKILIKINATSGWTGNFSTSDLSKFDNPNYDIAETSPQVVLTVLRQLVNVAGVPQNKIYVGDPMKHVYKHCYDLWHAEFPDVIYLDHDNYSSLGRTQAVKSTTDKIYYSDKGTVLGAAYLSDYLYQVFREVDYMINLPQLKGHARAGITIFPKNHLGSQTRDNAYHMHNGLVDPNQTNNIRTGAPLYRIQVDLMAHALLGGKELFYLLDALWAGSEAINPPDKWVSAPFSNDWSSSVFASQDPVAIESVGFDFLRTEYTAANHPGLAYPQMEGTDDYLHQAADPAIRPSGITYDPENDGTALTTSLGVHEHWNNAADKQYTRNLGTGYGIELIAPVIWAGTTSRDWNTASNWWGGAVPASGKDIIITPSPSNQPEISSTPTATCHHLTLLPGATLTINAGRELTVTGNFYNNGTVTIHSDGVSSSGSLIVNGASTGNVTYNRRMPAGSAWHYISSPVVLNSAPAASFFAWDETTGDWNAAATGIPAIGRAYTVLTTGNSVSFTGTIAGAVNEVSATSPYADCDWSGGETNEYNTRTFVSGRNTNYGGGGWNLLGNPYTSALDVSKFIDVNNGDNASSGDGSFDPNYEAVYLYDGSNFSYIGAQIPGFPNTNTGFGSDNVQVGQGFFVLSHCNTATFSFSPGTSGMQTHNTSVELKSAGTPWPGLALKVKSGQIEKIVTVVYNDKMSVGLDPGYDVGHLAASSELEIYTALVEDNGINFARQALPLAGSGKNTVPVGIDSEKGGEVTFSAFMNPIGNGTFYLEDRSTGIITDLSKNYYTVYLSPKTSGTGRFFLHTSTSEQINTSYTDYRLPITDYRGDQTGAFRIWTEGNRINIRGEVSTTASMAIFDLNGRKIVEHRLVNAEYNTFTVPVPVRGIYLVKITSGGKLTTQKVFF